MIIFLNLVLLCTPVGTHQLLAPDNTYVLPIVCKYSVFSTSLFCYFSGKCCSCNQTLDRLSLSDDEFKLLQTNVKKKLIVGSDLFLKTSPEELKRFTNFLRSTAPYDIVLDALNIAFATRQQHNVNRVNLLCKIVNNLLARNMKIMLLGRKHMLKWPRKQMQYLMSNTHSFFTDDL